jgi:hypothetical protein
VAWDVEFTDDFGTWWDHLTADEQESVDFGVGLLIERGPTLPFPYSSQVKGSQFGGNIKVVPTACSTLLTLEESACCFLVATRPEMTAGMTGWCQWPIGCSPRTSQK